MVSKDDKNKRIVLYDSDDIIIDLIHNYDGFESIRISYFKDGHWTGESWIDNVLSQDGAIFRKDV